MRPLPTRACLLPLSDIHAPRLKHFSILRLGSWISKRLLLLPKKSPVVHILCITRGDPAGT